MSDPLAVRCPGCGVLAASDQRDCRACGTLLPATVGASAREASAAADQGREETPRDVRGVVRIFVAFMLLVIGVRVASAGGAPGAPLDAAVTFIVGAMGIAAAFAARTEVGPLLARTGGPSAIVVATVGLGVLVGFGALYFPAAERLGFAIERATDEYRAIGWRPSTTYLLISVVPGITEELLFRGYVMARLDALLTPRETLVVQAALFALFHLGIVIFPSHFFIGLVLGAVRRRTRSLYPSMAVHTSWNGLVAWSELAGHPFP